MRPFPGLLLFSLAAVLFGCSADADTPFPSKLTLAQALAAASPGDGVLLLTVSAEKKTLPEGADPPLPDADMEAAAAAFGDETESFGAVTALAPATMVVLNTQPDPPDLAKDLTGLTAFNILASSLDDAQWQQLTSESGLGFADLSDDTQRSLFHALFSHGQLWIGSESPEIAALPQQKRTDVRDLTDQIDATRLRLGQMAMITLHDSQGVNHYAAQDRPDADERRHTFRPKAPLAQIEHGVPLRASVPNTLKMSDLDWDSRALQSLVPVDRLKTVDDLVGAAGRQTGLELYADPHYAARTVTFIGGVKAAPAADLLRALCLCVTGTFRKVGPAYVLTDDRQGVGIRRKVLADWENLAFQASMKLQEQAGKTMLEHRAADARKLPSFGDPLALTPEEMAAVPDDPGLPGIPSSEGVSYPISKLPAAQKAWVSQMAAAYSERLHARTTGTGDDASADVDLTHDVGIEAKSCLQLLVPTESAPVDTNMQFPMFMLFYPGYSEDLDAAYAAAEAKVTAKLPPVPPLRTTLHSGRLRAVLGHPRTAVDVDSLVTAMQKLGLNTLLLDVFSDGESRLKTGAAGRPDILTEALTRTRGTGIVVYADLSLLSWGDSPPEAVCDLTITGKTNREAAIESSLSTAEETVGEDGKRVPFAAPPVRVSPAAPEVHQALTALVQNLAARPALAGLVWEDADLDNDLGYTPAMRLAFLRAAHADPWDIDSGNYLRADGSLPLFDDKTADQALPAQWTKACTAAVSCLLGELSTAARPANRAFLPILMEQDSFRDHWLASWDDPNLLPPSLRDLSPGKPYAPQAEMMQIARTQGRIILQREGIESNTGIDDLQRRFADDRKALPGDGYVLDFEDDTVTQGAAPLVSLVRAVSAQNTVK